MFAEINEGSVSHLILFSDNERLKILMRRSDSLDECQIRRQAP
jgi:hypothetical protein